MQLRIFGIGFRTSVLKTKSVVLPVRIYIKSTTGIQTTSIRTYDKYFSGSSRSFQTFALSPSNRPKTSSMLPNTTAAAADTSPNIGTGITTPTTTGTQCVPCSSLDSSHKVDIDTLRTRLPIELPLWSLVAKTEEKSNNNTTNNNDSENYYMLSRSYTAKNFQCALDSINAMGIIAEEQNHHPDFHLTNYRDVQIILYTHTVNGITENDIALAKLLDNNIRIEYSAKWLVDHPEAIATKKT